MENGSCYMQEDKSSLIERSNSAAFGEVILCKEARCTGTLKKRVSRVSKKPSSHSLPRVHEDYYGPRRHKPKHH